MELLRRTIVWTRTGDAELPYGASVEGRKLFVRIGDFPSEDFYTLLVDDDEIGGFDTWPTCWQRPAEEG